MDKGLLIIRLLQVKLNTIDSLRELTKNNINFCEWKEQTLELLGKVSSNDQLIQEFRSIKYSPQKHPYLTQQLDMADIRASFQKGLDKAEEILKKEIVDYSSGYLQETLNDKLSTTDIETLVEYLKVSVEEKDDLKQAIKNIYNTSKYTTLQAEEKQSRNNTLAALLNKISSTAISL